MKRSSIVNNDKQDELYKFMLISTWTLKMACNAEFIYKPCCNDPKMAKKNRPNPPPFPLPGIMKKQPVRNYQNKNRQFQDFALLKLQVSQFHFEHHFSSLPDLNTVATASMNHLGKPQKVLFLVSLPPPPPPSCQATK